MSLLKLLTTGKCFIALREPSGRYQMTDPRSMPKFGGTTSPAGAAKTSDLPGCEAVTCDNGMEAAQCAIASESVLPSTAAAPGVETHPAEEPGVSPQDPGENPESGVLSWVARMRARVKARLSNRPRQSPPAVGVRPPRTAVQGELSLDLVKVVRNDLSDTDMEIVRVKMPTQVKSAPDAEGKRESAAAALSRAATRLFTVAKL